MADEREGKIDPLVAELDRLTAENAALKGENEWLRAAHILLANHEAFIAPAGGEFFFFSAEVDAEGTPLLALNMGDTFAYACADAEPFRYADAPDLLRVAKEEGWPGLVRWASKQRAERGEPSTPIKPVEDRMSLVDSLRTENAALREQLASARADTLIGLTMGCTDCQVIVDDAIRALREAPTDA